MLNGAKVKIQVSDGSDFAVLPMDKYTCQITDVNLKTQFNTFKQIEEDVLNYEFTVLDKKNYDIEKDGKADVESTRGRKLWKRCTPKFNTKSWLFKLASAAEGHDLTKDEQESFQPESIINKQVDVMVEIQDGTGKNAGNQYNNIISFAKTSKELEPFENDKTKEVKGKESKGVEVMSDEDSDEFIKSLEKEQEK